MAPQVKLGGPAASYASAALASIRRFTVTIGVSGKEDDLHLTINSDLGQTLADGMKKAFSAEIEKQRKIVEEKVNALYAQRAQQLQGQVNGLQNSLLAPLDRQRAALDEALKKAVTGSIKRSIRGLDRLKLFR